MTGQFGVQASGAVRRAARDDFNPADDSEAASRICGVDFADFDDGCDANPR